MAGVIARSDLFVAPVMAGLAGGWNSRVLRLDGQERRVSGLFVSRGFFGTLGVGIAAGRDFGESDYEAGAPPVAIISHRLARGAFERPAAALGRRLDIDGSSFTVVGIAPAMFRGIQVTGYVDVYLPLEAVVRVDANNWLDTTTDQPLSWIRVFGRLHGERDAALARLASATSGTPYQGWEFQLIDLNRAAMPEAARASVRRLVAVLFGTVGILFTCGCVTVGLLIMGGAEARRRDLAVRVALGAHPSRLNREAASETLSFVVVGGVMSVPIAGFLFRRIGGMELPGGIAIETAAVGWSAPMMHAVLAGCGLAWLATALTAQCETLQAPRYSLFKTPRQFGGPDTTIHLLACVLASAAFGLLAVTGMFRLSLDAALSLNPRIPVARLAEAAVELRAPEVPAVFAFERIRDELARRPDIAAAALVVRPLALPAGGALIVDGTSLTVPSPVVFAAIDDSYMDTLAIAPVYGRLCQEDSDDRDCAVVSTSLAAELERGSHGLGSVVELPLRPPRTLRIAGVVPDVVVHVDDPRPFVVYTTIGGWPASSYRPDRRTIVVRAATDRAVAWEEAVSTVRRLAPNAMVGPFASLHDSILAQMGPQRLGLAVLGWLAPIAALLLALGVYVWVDTVVSHRRKEFAVRLALGARRSHIGRLVARIVGGVVLPGLTAGMIVVLASAGALRRVLYGVDPLDWSALIVSAGLVVALATAVTLRPVGHALREPARVLRE